MFKVIAFIAWFAGIFTAAALYFHLQNDPTPIDLSLVGLACMASFLPLAFVGLKIDNQRFTRKLKAQSKFRVSHRLSAQVLASKVRDGVFKPYPPAENSLNWLAALSSRETANRFANWLDGAEPVTWVSPGRPAEVWYVLVGGLSNNGMYALSFEVDSALISLPKSPMKSYFACTQLQLVSVVPIPVDAELYVRKKRKWVEVRGEERSRLLGHDSRTPEPTIRAATAMEQETA